jgi:predicted RNA-binding protein Jag
MSADGAVEAGIADFLRRFLEASSLDIGFDITSQADPLPLLLIRFRGPDILILSADEGSVLEALRYLTAEIFGFPEDEASLMSFVVADAQTEELPGATHA